MEAYRSEDWTRAHFLVNDFLGNLLNSVRDHGYNPSHHISYDNQEHHLTLDPVILNKHDDIKNIYLQYLSACNQRDEAVEGIQTLPKLDLGF